MGEDTDEMMFCDILKDSHREIYRARIVIDEPTGAIVKNAYGKTRPEGSIAARAIHAAHARFRDHIGTPRESEAYAELKRIVEAIAKP